MKTYGTNDQPRLRVYRSLKHIYAQIIDDSQGNTLFSVSSLTLGKMKKVDQAKNVGKLIAEKAVAGGIKKIFFDRGKCKYHGRVKILADEARKKGLVF